MSLIPAFEIGLWNAWIFMLYNFLPMPLIMLIHRGLVQQMERPHSEIERKLYPVTWVVWILGVIYSVFLPLRLGTIWFYVGFPIAMVGVVTFTMVIVSFATTPIDTEPITKGLYRYSRHPNVHHSVGYVYRGGYSLCVVGFSTVYDSVFGSFICFCDS